MVSLLTNLLTSTEDLCLFESAGANLSYSFISKPNKVGNIIKASRFVDNKNQIHLFILDNFHQSFHVIWDNYEWKKQILPFSGWDNLATFVDSNNLLYILIKDSTSFQLWIWDETKYVKEKLMISNLTLKPLYVNVDEYYINIYFIDSVSSAITTNKISRETGRIQSYYTLVEDYKYYIIKLWIIEDWMILIQQVKSSAKSIRVLKLNLHDKENCLQLHTTHNLSKWDSYHLLVDKNYLLLLASSCQYFHYSFSSDRGNQWTTLHKSTLFSPVIFRDIQSVNNSPTSLICLNQINGTSLKYPLIMTLYELYRMICDGKVIYKDSVFKPRIQQKFFNR